MAKRKREPARIENHRYAEDVEKTISTIIYEQYAAAKRDKEEENSDFDAMVDMLECRRTEKDYDWMSDVFIPEYPSIHLTEASSWANQYFQTREFINVFLEEGTQGKIKAEAAKILINNLLNDREIYHYPKYMRARSINSIAGYCIAVCYWERTNKQVKVGKRPIQKPTEYDEFGGPINREPEFEDVYQSVPVLDRFNYDVVDNRNFYTDNSYCYSIQDKEWITIRSEMSYEQLKAKERENGYFNLDIVRDYNSDQDTETRKETVSRLKNPNIPNKQVVYFDVLESLRKIWAVVTEKNEDGYPVSIEPGYTGDGAIRDDAELIEAIVTVAMLGSRPVLIRYQPSPFRDALGRPYRPVIRGMCYIHPSNDIGMSDGKYSRELQVALNDTINISNDRVKLATFPSFKVRRYALEDNDTLFFEPEHPLVVEQMDDLEEFKITDNIQGAISQAGLFISKMQQVNAIYPTTMGELPGKASTTATAIAGAETRTNLRSNYKSLTFEYTFLQDFYWMILQMTYQFMHPMTAMKVMGPMARQFDPTPNYNYQPITSNIELEYSKDKKMQRIDGMVARLSNLAKINPAVIPIIAKLCEMYTVLLGEEMSEIRPMMQKFAQTPNIPEGTQGGQAPPDQQASPVSNQNQVPMLAPEEYARGEGGMGLPQ